MEIFIYDLWLLTLWTGFPIHFINQTLYLINLYFYVMEKLNDLATFESIRQRFPTHIMKYASKMYDSMIV